MKQKCIRLGIVISLLLAEISGMSQKPVSSLPLTADSLASGNSKDVFKSFFQIALDRLTSSNKEIQFTSNPFAVMAKMNPDLLIDTNYIKYTHLRNLNFSFAGKLDSSYRFNGFSSGIKYALINQRDETVSKAFVLEAFNANNEFNRLNDAIEKYIATIDLDDPRREKFRNEKNNMFRGKVGFNHIDTSFRRIVKEQADTLKLVNFKRLLEQDPDLNIFKASNQTYDSLKALFNKRLLWTVGVSDTTYKDQFLFSNIVLSTELTKGLSNPAKPLDPEINLRGNVNFIDHSLQAGRDLNRGVLVLEPGLNFVFKTRHTLNSWAEFKLSGSYYHILKGLYPNEKTDSLTLNGVLRIRIINDIWVPLEIKYDPKTGNVFGFLNIRANFNAMGGLFTKQQQ